MSNPSAARSSCGRIGVDTNQWRRRARSIGSIGSGQDQIVPDVSSPRSDCRLVRYKIPDDQGVKGNPNSYCGFFCWSVSAMESRDERPRPLQRTPTSQTPRPRKDEVEDPREGNFPRDFHRTDQEGHRGV